jgi:predicted DNA-binding WGR domain protein
MSTPIDGPDPNRWTYFRFKEGTSNKYWGIIWEPDKRSVTTHWGRVGTAGASQTKDFAYASGVRNARDSAKAFANKAINEKWAKGYRDYAPGAGDMEYKNIQRWGVVNLTAAAAIINKEKEEELQRLRKPEASVPAMLENSADANNKVRVDAVEILAQMYVEAQDVQQARRIMMMGFAETGIGAEEAAHIMWLVRHGKPVYNKFLTAARNAFVQKHGPDVRWKWDGYDKNLVHEYLATIPFVTPSTTSESETVTPPPPTPPLKNKARTIDLED